MGQVDCNDLTSRNSKQFHACGKICSIVQKVVVQTGVAQFERSRFCQGAFRKSGQHIPWTSDQEIAVLGLIVSQPAVRMGTLERGPSLD